MIFRFIFHFRRAIGIFYSEFIFGALAYKHSL